MLIQLSLRAYHLAFILDYLDKTVLQEGYVLYRQIDDKLNLFSAEGPGYLIEVSVRENEVMRIFEILTRSEEGIVAAINKEIDSDLGPQIYMQVEAERQLPMPTEEEIENGAAVPPKTIHPVVLQVHDHEGQQLQKENSAH